MEIEIGNITIDNEINIGDLDLDIIKELPSLENLNVTQSSVQQVFNHPNSYGYDIVTVEAVSTGTLNVTPTTQSQQHIGLYGTVDVEAVTSSIDANIQAGNIKNGVNILGVVGSLQNQVNELAEASITNVNLDTAHSIKNYLFQGCNNLTSVTVGDNVQTIGSYAFQNCGQLSNVFLGNHITNIYDFAFNNCTALQNITMPNSLTNLGQGNFANCYGLTTISLGNSLRKMGGRVFSGCENLINVNLGNSLLGIPNYAFEYCYSLTSIVLPRTITTIGSGAFQGCSSFETLDCTALTAVPTLSSTNVFSGTSENLKILVPSSLETQWKGATNWSTYANNIVGV